MTYILRSIDPALWRRIKSKAALEGTSINALILRLLTEWEKQQNAGPRQRAESTR